VKRVIIFSLLAIFSQVCIAQTYAFDQPISPNCFIKNVNDKIVLVHMKKDWNYEWMVFDSSLHLLKRNVFVTQKGPGLLRAHFIQVADRILYIEQVSSLDAITLTVSAFDEYGNISIEPKTIRVEESAMQRIRRAGQSYNLLLSPDKKLLLLTRAGTTSAGLNLSCILMDKNLQIVRQLNQVFSMDPELEDFEIIEPGNDGTLYFLKTDKFYNYRLSTKVNVYAISPGAENLKEKELFLSKRKIRSIRAMHNDNSILVTALCSTSEQDLKINAYLTMEFRNDVDEPATTREYFFKSTIGKELTNDIPGINRHTAVNRLELLRTESTPKGFGTTAVFGPVYSGRFVDRNSYNYLLNNFSFSGPNPYATSYSQRPYARVSMLDLISIRTDTATHSMNYDIHTIEKIEETFHKTWLQFMFQNRLHHIVYTESNKARMILTDYSFDDAGNLVKKKLYSNREITVEGGFPFVVVNNSLVAFYFHKGTDGTGLIRIRL
jgi:hypothetical protein